MVCSSYLYILLPSYCLSCSPGDQMVSVNGMSVFAMNVVQVKGLLASISGEEIELIVKSNTSLADGGNLPSSNW